ncbi:MAG: hypothetical protein ACREPA_03715 [Candidatus Dormibacteraceae bacterium]
MRNHAKLASATLAAILLPIAACGSSPRPSPGTASTCADPSAPHRVEVVVEHGSGRVLQRCVGFGGPSVTALEVMKESHLRFEKETTSFGVALCAIDGEPSRFSTCFPSGAPYWAMFVRTAGSGGAGGKGWKSPSVGVQGVTLRAGDALGWRYDPSAQNPAAPPPAPKPGP